jgi:DNA-binding CsgD family transcriptional regulator
VYSRSLINGKKTMESENLTPKELQVLELIAQGKFNKQIAPVLNCSEQTIKNHVQHIMEKLNANNRTEAVLIGVTKGLLSKDIYKEEVRAKIEEELTNVVEGRLRGFINNIAQGMSINLLNPVTQESKVLDTKYGDVLGFGNRRKYSFTTCPQCGIPRWIQTRFVSKNSVCYSCVRQKRMKKLVMSPTTIVERRNFGEPKILQIKVGKDIGRPKTPYQKFAQVVCPICKNARWIPIQYAKRNGICKNCTLYHGGLRGTHEEEIKNRTRRAFPYDARKFILRRLAKAEARVTELKLTLLKLNNKEESNNKVSEVAGRVGNEN